MTLSLIASQWIRIGYFKKSIIAFNYGSKQKIAIFLFLRKSIY